MGKKTDMKRSLFSLLVQLYGDLRWIWLNGIVNKIPFWPLRWLFYVLCGMKIGKRSRIGIRTTIVYPKGIKLGEGVIINEDCYIDGRGGLKIGNNTSISIYCKIITASHSKTSDKFAYYSNETVIGRNVWIGTGAIILDNSALEDECVIGAGTVLKGKADCGKVYIGNPAKVSGDRGLTGKYELRRNSILL